MKKALILAGGKGTRLLPLTLFTPKPLVPFFDKTLCERIISQLKKAGFSDIIISIGYQKEKIKNLFNNRLSDVKIRYIEEETPLGTAGALFYLEKYWKFDDDESFAVISGDCLFDFKLEDAIAAHKKANADITILSTKAKEPTEYGIINSDADGRIFGFNEKPSWSQVTGCNVNTGIYFIKAEVSKLVPQGTFDFSNDLFPLMLTKKMYLQEYKAKGFWSDIGTPESYYHAIRAALDGRIKFIPKTSEKKSEELSKKGVKVVLPAYISDSADIEHGCVIGPYSVISDNVQVECDSRVSHSVIHGNCKIGKGTKIDGSMLCNSVMLGDYCLVNQNSVLQEGFVLCEHGVFSDNKEIYNRNEKHCEEKNYFQLKKPLFFNDAVFISDLNEKPASIDICERICSSLVSASSENAKFGIMSEKSYRCAQFSQYFVFAIENLGARLYNFGEGFEKLAGFVAAYLHFDCFIYIFEKNDKIYCKFFNKNSLPPSRDFERKFEFFYYNTTENKITIYNPAKKIDNSEIFYRNEVQDCLLSYCAECALKKSSVSFINPKETRREFFILKQTFTELGGKICGLKEAYEKNRLIIKYSSQNGVVFEQNGICINRYSLIGAVLKEEKERGTTEFLLPVSYPNKYNSFFDGKEKIYSYPIHSTKRFDIPAQLVRSYHWLMDDILLASKALSLIAKKGSLLDIIKEDAGFFYCEDTIFLPEGFSNADMMEKLSSSNKNKTNDHFEGALIEFPDGKVTVVPQNRSCVKVYTEAQNEKSARHLFKQTENFILS